MEFSLFGLITGLITLLYFGCISTTVLKPKPSLKPRRDSFVCPEPIGTYPNPNSCVSYWICQYGAPIATTCNFGLIYSHKTMNCDWANINICTVIDGKVVRDWIPPPPPTVEPVPFLDTNGDPVDHGFNQQMKASFMSNGVSPTKLIEIRFNITKKGKEPPSLSPYELLIAKWKFNQKNKKKLSGSKNESVITIGSSYNGEISMPSPNVKPGLSGPLNYILPESITPAPRKIFTVAPIGDEPPTCNPKRCRLPRCYCDSNNIPGGLTAENTPQIVLITFDDAINSQNLETITRLLSPNRTNPNGCPVSGTFFLANAWTDYKIVTQLYESGHEFASHSLNHKDMTNYDEKQWRNEIVGQAEVIHEYGKVNQSDIVGMRAPFLAVGGNTMYKMLWKNGFMYDSSIPSQQTDPPLWPYTFDSRMPHKCFQEPCPTGYFPSLWEVPMTYYMGLNNIGCSMYDACVHPGEPDEVADLFYTNFLKHYESNRAPYLLSAHTAWYSGNPGREEAMMAFMDRALKLGDVWFVTVREALEWMQSPTPISKIMDFKPWQCKK